jgi:hypothetical protein
MLRGVNLSQALVVLRITLAMKVSSYWLMKPSRTAGGSMFLLTKKKVPVVSLL